jgi:hypothetical protein
LDIENFDLDKELKRATEKSEELKYRQEDELKELVTRIENDER